MRTALFSTTALRQRATWVALVFALALSVRLGALALTFPGNDAVQYYDDAQIALNIIDGNGFAINYPYRNWLFYEAVLTTAKLQNPILEGTRPTAVKQPLNAWFLTAVFFLFGARNFAVVFVLHALMSAGTVALLFLCLRRTAPVQALVISCIAALYPAFVIHAVTVPESTTLLLLLIAALWLCTVRVAERPSLRVWAMSGALAGMAILTEPVMLPLLAVSMPLAVWLDRRPAPARFKGLALAAVVSAAVLSPWLIRNYVVFDRFPVLKSGMGLVFNWGLHVSGNGSWIPEERMVEMEREARSLSELEEDEAIRRELISRFPSHWREYVFAEIPNHFLYLWWDVPRYWNDYSTRYLFGRRIPFVLLFCLAFPEVVRTAGRLWRAPTQTLRQQTTNVSALVLLVVFTGVYTLFGAFHSRYRFPLELALCVFAAGTLVYLLERSPILLRIRKLEPQFQ